MLTTNCPRCNNKIYPITWSFIECSNCGERLTRKEFEINDVHKLLELENAKSLRSIACSLQILAMAQVLPQDRDAVIGEFVGPLDG